MFSKDHFDKILQLNEEFMLASASRRREIELEIISLVPASEFPHSTQLSEISNLQQQLKDKINSLAQAATESDLEKFIKEIEDIDDQICKYSNNLGVEMQKTEYGKILSRMIRHED
jgi:predicted sugar kinase